MKSLGAILLFLIVFSKDVFARPRAGFYLPDSVQEVSITFGRYKDLIILPVVINDTVQVNLVLDTGCRNLVLFGSRFRKYFATESQRSVQFSGLGDGQPKNGQLFLGNKVSIHAVLGEKIPVVVIPECSLFKKRDHIDGIIGYDIFIKFEIELNLVVNRIKFRPAMSAQEPQGYNRMPMRIEDSRPLISSMIFFENKRQPLDVMIDTGSSLGLLLKTTDLEKFETTFPAGVIGRGLNGPLVGTEILASKLLFSGFEFNNISMDVTESPWHNEASLGMRVLKEYSIVINYCKAYVCFRKNS